MISRLIFNADDFALTALISAAIIEAHQQGVVTSTTILANCDEKLLLEAVEYSKHNPDLGFGAHLVLTTRRPLLETHKTLVDESGNFGLTYDTLDKVDTEEVYMEWKAQLDRLSEHFELTHIDSHHHVHLHPKLRSVVRKLGDEYGIPIRDTKDGFPKRIHADLGFYAENTTFEYLKSIMKKHKGLVEIMVHPGYKDDVFLQEISSYVDYRQTELEVLKSQELKDFIKSNNINLVNYNVIQLRRSNKVAKS